MSDIIMQHCDLSTFSVPDVLRMEDGTVAEQWPAIDNLGLQQQIGLLES